VQVFGEHHPLRSTIRANRIFASPIRFVKDILGLIGDEVASLHAVTHGS